PAPRKFPPPGYVPAPVYQFPAQTRGGLFHCRPQPSCPAPFAMAADGPFGLLWRIWDCPDASNGWGGDNGTFFDKGEAGRGGGARPPRRGRGGEGARPVPPRPKEFLFRPVQNKPNRGRGFLPGGRRPAAVLRPGPRVPPRRPRPPARGPPLPRPATASPL